MSLKKSAGNMYPWVTHTHCHLGGECPHKCVYCYVDNPRWGRPAKYTGPLRLIEKEFSVKYDKETLEKDGGKYPGVIFIENCNDLFAEEVPQHFINKAVHHCLRYPENTFVFQTKNPARYLTMDALFPENSIFGCTIETNRAIPEIGNAPSPAHRSRAMEQLTGRKFITIEPIMDLDPEILANWIRAINPEFVNIGADSKSRRLPEPKPGKVRHLIALIEKAGIEIREKHNLGRIM